MDMFSGDNISRPSAAPETCRMAVRVINRYGDEGLKDYEVR